MTDERPRQRRTYVGFRLAPSGLSAVDELAAELGKTRSQVLRFLLALGFEQWRKATAAQRAGWSRVHGLIDKAED